MSGRSVAVVAGALANKAGLGGEAWVRLSWAQGMSRLGFAVHLVEQLAEGAPADGADYFADVVATAGLHATLLDAAGGTVHGLAVDELTDLLDDAAVLLNISGHLRLPHLLDRCRRRVYVDLDPAYTQWWHHEGLVDLGDHHHWYTVGLEVGSPDCAVPTGDLPWRPIVQPVVLDDWPDVSAATTSTGRVGAADGVAPDPRFTTVASWRGGGGTIEIDGRWLGAKAREFRRLLPLPRMVPGTLEIALDIHPGDDADRDALLAHGWRLSEPDLVAGHPWAFRDYVQGSAAELSVAQEAYVGSRCGWFSDRTTRYLASGRPAVVQDTGFHRHLPVGEGLLTFHDLDGAAAAVRSVIDDPDRHAKAARAIAEQYFSADVVLAGLCEELDVAP